MRGHRFFAIYRCIGPLSTQTHKKARAAVRCAGKFQVGGGKVAADGLQLNNFRRVTDVLSSARRDD